MRYGDIIKTQEGYLCKVTGICIENNEKCYTLKPIVEEVVMLKDYIEQCELVKENHIGIELEF